jgi:hypothetical protein
MPVHVNDNGVWKTAAPYVNDNGTWVLPKEIWVNDNGVWKQAHSSTTFTPTNSPVYVEGTYDAVLTLTCNVPATWTYTRTGGTAGAGNTLTNLPSGGSGTQMYFSVSSPGDVGNRSTVDAYWSVTGTASGVSKTWTIYLTAHGDSL